jgi:hypothetical protein
MEKKFNVNKHSFYGDTYIVSQTVTIFGNRISLDETEPDKIETTEVFRGTVSDCYSFIRLVELGYLEM